MGGRPAGVGGKGWGTARGRKEVADGVGRVGGDVGEGPWVGGLVASILGR